MLSCRNSACRTVLLVSCLMVALPAQAHDRSPDRSDDRLVPWHVVVAGLGWFALGFSVREMLEAQDETLAVLAHDHTGARVLAPAKFDWHHVKAGALAAAGRYLIEYRADDVTINLKPQLLAAAQVEANGNAGPLVWRAYAETDGVAKSELLLLRALYGLRPLRAQVPDKAMVEVDRIASVFAQLWQLRLPAKVYADLEAHRILPRRVHSVHEQVQSWTAPNRVTAEDEVLAAVADRAAQRQQHQEYRARLVDLVGAVQEFAKAPR